MKTGILFIGLSIVLAACKTPNTKIKERISNADSVAINYFRGDGTMDTAVAVKIVKDKKVITQLSDFISAASATPQPACGYDGSLHFFKMNMVVQDIDFRMNDAACMFFTFKQEGKYTATILSPEVKQLLQTMQK